MLRNLALTAALLQAASIVSRGETGEWEPLGPFGGSVHVISLDPNRPRHLLAGTRNGLLFRSADAAAHWSPLPLPRFPGTTLHAAIIDPSDGRRLWVGLKDPKGKQGGLWRSDDSGATWRPIVELAGRSVLSITVRTTQPRWYAAGTNEGVYWSETEAGPWKLISPPGHPEMNGIVSLAADPREPETLYAGTTHLPWKTADLGKTWNSIHNGMIDDSDVFSILTDGRSAGRVYASACSGIYSSQNGGAAWKKAEGIPADNRRTYIITQDREYPNLVYAGTTQGLWKSADSGATWKKLHPMPVNWLAVDPSDGRVMYLATDGGGVLKTMDAGRSFVQRNHGLVNRTITSLAASSKGLWASTMYEGDYGGVFFSDDRGAGWDLVANRAQLKGENVRRISWAGDRLVATTFEGRLASRDGGKSWVRSAQKAPAEAALPKISGLTVFDATGDPANPRLRLAATSDGIRRSVDGGKTWSSPRSGLPSGFIRAVSFHPKRPLECYASQYANLYRSKDGGQTWEQVGGVTGAPLPFTALVISPWMPDTVFAISEDRGIWRRRI